MKLYENAGLTQELHQRLVVEFNALKEQHHRTFTHHIMKTKQCNRQHARKYAQRFDNVVKERLKLSPKTLDEMREYLSEQLANDLEAYLSKHYIGSLGACRPETDTTNAGLTEELFQQYREDVDALKAAHHNNLISHIRDVKGCTYKEANTIRSIINLIYTEQVILTPRKVIQLEGLLSRELFGKIAKYVFNTYDWPDSLERAVDRIILEYRTKGELGRNKKSVKQALYKAISMGL